MFDIVCFSINNWERRRARKQQFMLHLSLRDDVGKVMYVEPPLNLFRLLFLPFLELKTQENRKRWLRALSFNVECLSNKLYLFTPIFVVPFSFRIQAIYNVNRYLSYLCIRNKLKALGFRNIVLWIYHPFDYYLSSYFKERIFSCFDWAEEWAEYFIEYSQRKRRVVKVLEEKVIAGVDAVFVVSKRLLEIAKSINSNSYQICDGTIPEIFLEADKKMPPDMEDIKHPIIGYGGTIYRRMDLDLISELSDKLPQCSFVFIGDVLLKPVDIARLKEKKNVFFLGVKQYSELPNYLTNFDVCILPYIPIPYTSPPTKIYDYLTTGKPIVSTYFSELKDFSNLIRLARTKEEFINFVRESLSEDNPDIRKMRIEKAKENSWSARAGEMMNIILRIIREKRLPFDKEYENSSYKTPN